MACITYLRKILMKIATFRRIVPCSMIPRRVMYTTLCTCTVDVRQYFIGTSISCWSRRRSKLQLLYNVKLSEVDKWVAICDQTDRHLFCLVYASSPWSMTWIRIWIGNVLTIVTLMILWSALIHLLSFDKQKCSDLSTLLVFGDGLQPRIIIINDILYGLEKKGEASVTAIMNIPRNTHIQIHPNSDTTSSVKF